MTDFYHARPAVSMVPARPRERTASRADIDRDYSWLPDLPRGCPIP